MIDTMSHECNSLDVIIIVPLDIKEECLVCYNMNTWIFSLSLLRVRFSLGPKRIHRGIVFNSR